MNQVYTVTEVNRYIKNIFSQEVALTQIAISGEVSNCKYHSSGHIYFTLKDSGSRMACVMFAGNRRGLTFHMDDGASVVVVGSINVYERDGKYQLYATQIVQEGSGQLYERLEILKKKLSKEGLFSDVNKKKLPFYAKTVGIITASTGAAIQDIVNIASRRNSGVQLYLYPAIVQGADAAESIAKGIRYMDQMRLDVLIVGRGGGSFEDLFAFNEEVVIRAIYECETPVISAVGHETDTTLSDYVADMRAPTPSAAAELAVSLKSDIYEKLDQYKAVFTKSLEWKVNQYQNRYKLLEAKMLHKSPTEQVRQKRLYAIELEDKLTRIINRSLENLKGRLLLDTEKLKVLSPLHRLSGGYSYVQNEEGEALTSISQVAKEDKIRITLKDGKLDAKVNDLVRSDIRWHD